MSAKITSYEPTGVPSGAPLMSQVVKVHNTVYTAGQVGIRPDGTIPSDYEGQVKQAIVNLEKCLSAAGAKITDIAHLRYYAVGYDATITGVQVHYKCLKEWLNGHRPCTTLVPVPCLAKTEFLFEIEAVAIVA